MDSRSAAEHLANIRQVFRPAIADLVSAFGAPRPAIYGWLGGEVVPGGRELGRIRVLSLAADVFQVAGVAHAPSLLSMKEFGGRSLLDLAAAGQLKRGHVQALIAEARAMDAAYNRAGLARSKAAPSDDWRAAISVPGALELRRGAFI